MQGASRDCHTTRNPTHLLADLQSPVHNELGRRLGCSSAPLLCWESPLSDYGGSPTSVLFSSLGSTLKSWHPADHFLYGGFWANFSACLLSDGIIWNGSLLEQMSGWALLTFTCVVLLYVGGTWPLSLSYNKVSTSAAGICILQTRPFVLMLNKAHGDRDYFFICPFGLVGVLLSDSIHKTAESQMGSDLSPRLSQFILIGC